MANQASGLQEPLDRTGHGLRKHKGIKEGYRNCVSWFTQL